MKVKAYLAAAVTIPGQWFFMVVSSVIIFFLFQAPLEDFNPVGRTSFVLPVTSDVINGWGKEPARVKTGLLIYEFLKFEPTKNDFLLSGIIWFEFDPTKVSKEIIDNFTFNKGEIIHKSDPLIKEVSKTQIHVQYHFKVHFTALCDYSLFPFDDHIISLNLVNDSIEATDMVYEVALDDFIIPSYVYLYGWKIVKRTATAGYNDFALSATSQASLQPKIVFSLSVKKEEVRLLLLMLLPLIVLFYLSLFMLSLKDMLNIDAILALVTAFMASAIVTQGMSPDINYFMVIDYLTIFFLLAIFAVFLVGFLAQSSHKYFSTEHYKTLKGCTVLALHVAMISVIYYLTHVYKVPLL